MIYCVRNVTHSKDKEICYIVLCNLMSSLKELFFFLRNNGQERSPAQTFGWLSARRYLLNQIQQPLLFSRPLETYTFLFVPRQPKDTWSTHQYYQLHLS